MTVFKLLLKIVVAPVIVLLTLFVWTCVALVYVSGLVLGLASMVIALLGVAVLVTYSPPFCQPDFLISLKIIKQYIKQFFRRPTDHAAAIIEDVPNFVKLYPDISIPALADLQLRIQRQIVLENLQNLFKGQHLALNSFTGLLYYLPLLSGKRR